MDRLNRHIENQIRYWIFQKEHAELGAFPVHTPYDASYLPLTPVREPVKEPQDERPRPRF